MKQTIAILVTLMLILTGCSSDGTMTGKTVEGSGDPIKIGWIGPLSGPASLYGTEALNGAKIALEKINSQGGIDGRQVDLVVEDGKCDGPSSATAAIKLTEVDNLKYIIGGHCSTESLTIVPITDPKKILVLAGATSTDKFTGLGKYSFRTVMPTRKTFGRMADYAFAQGHRRIAIIHEQKDFGKSVSDAFSSRFNELGGEIVTIESFPSDTLDFRNNLIKIRSISPDAIMISAQAPPFGGNIIKQMDELNLTMQIFGDPFIATKQVYEASGGKLPSTAIGGFAHVDPEKNPKNKQFIQDYALRYGMPKIDPYYSSEGYDDVNIITDLIRMCGDDTDCARDKMLTQKWDGATTEFSFNDQGDIKGDFIMFGRYINGTTVFFSPGGN